MDSDDRPFVPFRQDMELDFHLRLDNRDFALFTDLSATSNLATPVYETPASNPGAGGELTARSDDTPLSIPLRGSVFAQIRIRQIAADWLADGPVVFTITFQPKQARWVYYFVTQQNGQGNGRGRGNPSEPTIVDNDPGSLRLAAAVPDHRHHRRRLRRRRGRRRRRGPDRPATWPPNTRTKSAFASSRASSSPASRRPENASRSIWATTSSSVRWPIRPLATFPL